MNTKIITTLSLSILVLSSNTMASQLFDQVQLGKPIVVAVGVVDRHF